MRLMRFIASLSAALAIAIGSGGTALADEGKAAWSQAASHAGRIEGDHITWQSSFVESTSVDPSAAWERIDLVRPVAGELDAARSPGVAAVVDAKGAIVALAIDTRRLPGWREAISVTLRAPLVRDGGDVVLSPPLARGEAVQRIDVSGEEDLRFEPEPSLGFVHNVGSWSAPGISESERHLANARLEGRETPLDESPMYVEASSPVLEHGLRGRALTGAERARPGLVLAVSLFVLLGAACAAAYRLLGRDARIEQAEAVLREEYERDGH